MNTEYERILKNVITEPLQNVAGRTLRAVNYFYILWDEFSPETPNQHGGCQGIHLVFDGGEVEFDWASEKALRDPFGNIAYHLAVLDHSGRRQALQGWTEEDCARLRIIAATETRLWRSHVGELLERIEVLGDRLDEARFSPQAVRLHFPSAAVIIAIGMTSSEVIAEGRNPVDSVGDGDEVLVFSEQEWAALPRRGIDRLIACWNWPN